MSKGQRFDNRKSGSPEYYQKLDCSADKRLVPAPQAETWRMSLRRGPCRRASTRPPAARIFGDLRSWPVLTVQNDVTPAAEGGL